MSKKTARASFTRPANTTAYAQGDLVANHATAASVVPLALALARGVGGAGKIVKVGLAKSGVDPTNAAFRVHFFRDAPVVGAGDNAAIAADGVAKGHLGSIDLTIATVHSDGVSGVADAALPFDCPEGEVKIYALLEARAAYAPASGETFSLAISVERD
jgi:hypothetical protein